MVSTGFHLGFNQWNDSILRFQPHTLKPLYRIGFNGFQPAFNRVFRLKPSPLNNPTRTRPVRVSALWDCAHPGSGVVDQCHSSCISHPSHQATGALHNAPLVACTRRVRVTLGIGANSKSLGLSQTIENANHSQQNPNDFKGLAARDARGVGVGGPRGSRPHIIFGPFLSRAASFERLLRLARGEPRRFPRC